MLTTSLRYLILLLACRKNLTEALNLNWEQAARLPKDRQIWRSLVDALLCAAWRLKD